MAHHYETFKTALAHRGGGPISSSDDQNIAVVECTKLGPETPDLYKDYLVVNKAQKQYLDHCAKIVCTVTDASELAQRGCKRSIADALFIWMTEDMDKQFKEALACTKRPPGRLKPSRKLLVEGEIPGKRPLDENEKAAKELKAAKRRAKKEATERDMATERG